MHRGAIGSVPRTIKYAQIAISWGILPGCAMENSQPKATTNIALPRPSSTNTIWVQAQTSQVQDQIQLFTMRLSLPQQSLSAFQVQQGQKIKVWTCYQIQGQIYLPQAKSL